LDSVHIVHHKARIDRHANGHDHGEHRHHCLEACPRLKIGEEELDEDEADKGDDEDQAPADPRGLGSEEHAPESKGMAQVKDVQSSL